MGTLQFTLRRQRLITDEDGYTVWRVNDDPELWPAAETALLLCDVWDSHWCRGARERLDDLIPQMNATVNAARDAGIQIVHAPSGTMEFYADHPARKRVLDNALVDLPDETLPPPAKDSGSLVGAMYAPSGTVVDYDPPLPIDASDHGSDTGETEPGPKWARQHAGIDIDGERDLISDDGHQVYSCLLERQISGMLILGVHTNMCVLHRTFGIKQMTKWGMEMVLIRDLTDTMYSPARPPYVGHEGGTQLVIYYIEKFWCPTALSSDILKSSNELRI
ncbi:MAG: hypothetical protein VYB08_12630, partial [Candidatus Latescibacterota bacterium]|nr:hypothetical protein [Candidatus Latescibacterota bacterium]